MVLAALILALFIAAILAVAKRRRASTAIYVSSLVLFLAAACGPIPAWLLGGLQSPYAVNPVVDWGQRNAIVLLGAGIQRIPGSEQLEPGLFSYSRIVRAAELYRDCATTQADCKIIVSGGDAQRTGASEALIYRDVLIRMGVQAKDVVAESRSMNTWQNAQFTSTLLSDYHPQRVLLVSSGIHLRRGVLYFAHFGVSVLPVRADYLKAVPSLLPLAYNLAMADVALHEYIGIARYHVYNALGWNPARTLPGQA